MAILSVLGLIILAALYLRPVPVIKPQINDIQSRPAQLVNLPWPGVGQAALGAQGYGLLETQRPASPAPIASISKVITALALLQKKPIQVGTQGQTVTLGKGDVDLFNYYYLNDGSVAKVSDGEHLTEYQALEAMLLPSANNLADSMAVWAFGSMDNYITYANRMVKDMEMLHTTVGGASGFSDDTTSTAGDLVRLGLAALNNPLIAEIVQKPSATVPVAGTVKNVNWLLGQDGVMGIKTGNTQKAGGCYLFAARRTISGQTVTLVGSILGDSSLNNAIHQADKIIKASDSGFQKITAIHKGQNIGEYRTPWGASARLTIRSDASFLTWKDSPIKVTSEAKNAIAPATAGSSEGEINVSNAGKTIKVPLVLANDLPGASWHWRIFHR